MNNRNLVRYRSACFESGFTLLEILVALIVLSVGLLSLAGLQVIGLRTNHNAYMRSQATILSYDIADRMRANVRGIENGNYHQPTVAGSQGVVNAACETTNGCSSAQMAGHDLFRWNQMIANVLPNGIGMVCIDSTPEDGIADADDDEASVCDDPGTNFGTAIYTIKIWWRDDPSQNPQRFTTSFRP